MVTHIVAWKFKPESEVGSHADIIAAATEKIAGLRALIPEIVSVRCGADFLRSAASYDFGLIAEFKTVADFEIYRVHPHHLPVIEHMASVAASRVVVDFEG